MFRPDFLSKVSRTSVTKHYGYTTLMYGVLLLGPDIGKRATEAMRATRDAGHECGVHSRDHVYWQDEVRQRDAAWTRAEMGKSFERFRDVFGHAPQTHGAAGWQMNATAFEQLDDWGMAYASDGRGHTPYRIRINGRTLRHVQMPTALSTLDELIGADGITEDNVAQHLLKLTASAPERDRDQVYTLHAELEGNLLAPAFAALLDGWRAQGHELVTMADLTGSAHSQAQSQAQAQTVIMAWSARPPSAP